MIEHPSEDLLALYAGGEARLEERRAVEIHLQICAKCFSTVAAFTQIRQTLGTALADPASDELQLLRGAVKTAISAKAVSRSRRWQWGIAAVAAAAMLVCLLLVNRKERTPNRVQHTLEVKSLPLPARQLTNLAWSPPRKALASVHASARIRPGIRAVSLITQRDGSSELKLITTDPNVVILLPLQERTDHHEN